MVWQKGITLYGEDGVGHVAIVEQIIDDETILTSESDYGGFVFANMIRCKGKHNWNMKDFIFRGCIENPKVQKLYKNSNHL